MEEGSAKAKEHNILFIETSAKAGFNVKALFRKVASALPGMENTPLTNSPEVIDVTLEAPTTGSAEGAEAAGGVCNC
jgi:Ras-related protein Rab-6A